MKSKTLLLSLFEQQPVAEIDSIRGIADRNLLPVFYQISELALQIGPGLFLQLGREALVECLFFRSHARLLKLSFRPVP